MNEDLADRIARLPPEQRARLEERLLARAGGRAADDGAGSGAAAGIQPRPRPDEPAPLSLAQERIWFLEQLDPASASFNTPRVLRLRGPLRQAALQAAFDAIVARHEALRTRFFLHNGRPAQQVMPARPLPLPLDDLSDLPPTEREARASVLIDAIVRRPFQLDGDLLTRAHLLRLGPDDHLLVLAQHHIASDAWSASIYYDELAAVYAALARNEQPDLERLPIQYADYACWQRARLDEETRRRQLAEWTERLAGVPMALDLPTDFPRPDASDYPGASVERVLPPALLARLRRLGRAEGATLFMTLLAGWNALLFRLSGQEDFVIGTPVAGRGHPDTTPLIGLFLNVVLLRADLAGEPSFRALLERTRETARWAFARQDVPFARLIEALRAPRDPARSAVFQVLFILQNARYPTPALPGLDVTDRPVPVHAVQHDLGLIARETEEGLALSLEYRRDLFSEATAARWLGMLARLLEGAVADPDTAVARLPLLSPEEDRLVSEVWPREARSYPVPASLLAAFQERVRRAPGAVAFRDDANRVTYATLDETSGRLAAALRARGCQPGDVVGLCLPRSLQAMTATMALLRLGAVTLPLDPTYPVGRLRAMLDDAGAAHMVTTASLARELAAGTPALCLDADAAFIAGREPWPGDESPPPERPIFLFYTSGSTGPPKGVLVPERQLLYDLAWLWDAYPFASDEVGAVIAPLSSVDSLWQIFGGLLAGVPARVISDDELRDPEQLVAALADAGVTRLWLVPTLLQWLLATTPDLGRRLPRLRFWVATGEAAALDLAERFRAAAPGAALFNLYGTSELGDVTWYEVPLDDDDWAARAGSLPIGRPVAGMEVYVLGPQDRPQPIGVPGELVVGGMGVAPGYWNRPELTAERFVPHPFRAAADGARVYRTGDRARWRADGQLEFLGRLDRQVKIRGYRVEPGGIEALLLAEPAVAEAAVVYRTRPGVEEPQLLAYVAPRPDEDVPVTALRARLRAELPAYMVPVALVVLERLPRTPSGKVDAAALPEPGQEDVADRALYAPPADELESALVEIWERVLGVSPVGVHHDFFELGGHSLLAVTLFADIEAALGRRLPLGALFEAPTVARLAARLREASAELPAEGSAWSPLVPMRVAGERPPLFLVPPSATTVYTFNPMLAHLEPDQPVYGLQYAGMAGEALPERNVEAIAARNIAAMRGVWSRGPYLLAGRCFGGIVAYEMARQLRAAGAAVPLVAVLDTMVPPNVTAEFFGNEGGRLAGWRTWLVAGLRRAIRFARFRRRYRAPDRLPDALGDYSEHIRQTEIAHARARVRYDAAPTAGRLVLLSNAEQRSGRELNWAGLTTAGLEMQVLPGGHLTMFQEPHVARLVAALRSARDRALAPEEPEAASPDRALAPGGLSPAQRATAPRPAGSLLALAEAPPAGTSLVLLRGGAAAPFFCVPAHDEAPAALLPLADRLGQGRPVYGFRPIGLAPGETPCATIAELAARYVRDMRAAWAAGPYRLAGHGSGGIVAFEMARQLVAAGEEVALLAVLDTLVPPNAGHLAWTPPRRWRAPEAPRVPAARRLLGRFVYAWQWAGLALAMPWRELAGRPLAGRTRGWLGPEAGRLRRTALAQFHARLRYYPDAYPGEITLIASARHRTRHQSLWGLLTTRRLAVELVDCRSEELLAPPAVDKLAAILRGALRDAPASPDPAD